MIAPIAATPQGAAMMLSAPGRTLTPSPSQQARRISIGTTAASRIAYLVINDEELGGDLSTAIEHCVVSMRGGFGRHRSI
jgi:hypothetical protein